MALSFATIRFFAVIRQTCRTSNKHVVSGLWWQASTEEEILNAGIGAQWAVHLM